MGGVWGHQKTLGQYFETSSSGHLVYPPRPEGSKGRRQGINMPTSLPVSFRLLLVPLIGRTQPEARVKAIRDVVHKGQPPGTQSQVKKYVEYLWGPHGRSPACLPFPPLLSLPSKAVPIVITVLPPHPISDSLLFVIQPFPWASSSPISLPQAPFCHDMGDTVGIVCSVEIGILSSFSPLLLPNLSTGLVRSKPKKCWLF